MSFKRFMSTLILKGKKYSPELLLAAGVITGISATVVACKATLHADEILDTHAENMEKIKKAEVIETNDEEKGVEVAIENSKKDKAIVYGRTVGSFIRLYAPAVGLGALSLACFLSSYGIMRKRNIALTAAYTALDGFVKKYRGRVREEMGEDMDRHFAYGTEKRTREYEETDGKGKVVKKTADDEVITDAIMPSDYAKWFDESSPCWEKSAATNLAFLKAQENSFNELLHAKGYVFLNDVYRALGIRETAAGQLVGWIDGNGDNYIDFGIYDCNRIAKDFVNGWEKSILLDFNVDGVIYDKI